MNAKQQEHQPSTNDDHIAGNSSTTANAEALSQTIAATLVGDDKIVANNNEETNKMEDDNNGNYDELPLIKIDTIGDEVNGHGNRMSPVVSGNLAKSDDSIPFIDESPRKKAPATVDTIMATPIPSYHDTRFITIEPQNIGSAQHNYHYHHQRSHQNIFPANRTIIVGNGVGVKKIELIHTAVVPKREQFDKSVQILYQSQMELPVAHHFEMVDRLNEKLCQVCHEFLLVSASVRCLTCGFVCHENCVATKVSFCFIFLLKY